METEKNKVIPMLYLCATPIGNYADISYRAVKILSSVSAIYAEDTRHSALLLQYLDIKKPLISCHQHNEQMRAVEICDKVLSGQPIAFISDAGMPCVSDPGARLVSEAIKRNVPYTVIPGACAFVTALALSGQNADSFAFYGFLPRSGADRKKALKTLADSKITSVIYESPNRVGQTLSELSSLVNDERKVSLVREITKLFEEVATDNCITLSEKYQAAPPKGECVIVVSPKEDEVFSKSEMEQRAKLLLSEGQKTNQVAKQLAAEFLIGKNEAYALVLNVSE